MTTLTIPSGVTSIGRTAISRCASLTEVTIPNTVATIGAFAFEANPNLTTLTIPASVASIDKRAFSYCKNLVGVYFGGNAPVLGKDDVFHGNPTTQVYYRPGTTGWGKTFGGCPTIPWKP
jgi:hypothetical protein